MISKDYFFEIRQFKQIERESFNEINYNCGLTLFIFKPKSPKIAVYCPNPIKKIHGWSLNQIVVLQQMNDNPLVFHYKSVTIPFMTDLVLTLLPQINQSLNFQINEAIPRKTPHLEAWMKEDIDDVILISEKKIETNGFTHGFMQIETVLRNRYKNFMQLTRWKSDKWQGLLQIAESQNIKQNSSYGLLLCKINNFIMQYEVIRDSKYTHMFEKQDKKKSKQYAKDDYQLKYERKILQKYHLYEYIEEK